MLDADTKRRIDTARDILVGKIPDPKSQVEQITIALVYKFMDDMDAEAEEFGGKRKFFAGDFAKYGWAKLMRSGLGGHETLNLYAEAITKMPQNPGIPPLFRLIFKNAFLPYRDPETLRAFLKIIDEFDYDHSERLGDAFEYLLSVLGAQGDAGQFRTPRHIIDFMVEVIDPKKDETVLDPACGTAGFLISSYKHILRQNTDAKGASTLTPDEKGKLAHNFKGYDISPDMVRLSLVNMYLHGFNDPHIDEYDTLTSEDKWNEFSDVILANPPFMSPKGGIRPHRRFSVESKRSEVLFVDYMAEHLTPKGRAAVIVPEGIIFQSGTAYKQLRKMLVEEYLVAVVSLPAGVFNPYSGVKTSILFLDKSLAKRNNTIGFFKVENDGYNLGAQRRPIDRNDLPNVKEEISIYLRKLKAGEAVEDIPLTMGLVVSKEKIAESGDYNLSGERYKTAEAILSSFPLVPLGDLCEIRKGSAITRKQVIEGPIPVIAGGQTPSCFHNEANRDGETITVSASGAYAGFVSFFDEPIFASDCSTIRPIDDRLLCRFLFYLLKNKQEEIYKLQVGMGQPHVYPKDLVAFQFPLPPLELQKEIVAEIEGYQKIIDGARAVIDNYRPHIPIDPEWPFQPLGKISDIIMGQSPSGETYNKEGIGLPLINGPVEFGPYPFSKTVIKQYTSAPTKLCKKGDLILCVRGSTTGRMNIAGYDGCIGRGVAAIRSKNFQFWINFVINVFHEKIYRLGSGSTFPNVTSKTLASLMIPMPPQDIQSQIVDAIIAEQAIIDGNRELITRFEKKIQTTLARIWGDEK